MLKRALGATKLLENLANTGGAEESSENCKRGHVSVSHTEADGIDTDHCGDEDRDDYDDEGDDDDDDDDRVVVLIISRGMKLCM